MKKRSQTQRESQRVTIKEAAETLGMSQQAVREWCKLEIIPCTIISKDASGKAYNQYFIPRPKFMEFLGMRGVEA